MWTQSKDGQRWRRPLSDGTRAVASQLSDQSFAVSVNFRYVLSGYKSLPEVMRDFDAFVTPLKRKFDYSTARIGRVYKRRARRVKPVAEAVVVKGKDPNACSNDEGHWFRLPAPAKGNGGLTEGRCKHCGAIRAMCNVEGAPQWNGPHLPTLPVFQGAS